MTATMRRLLLASCIAGPIAFGICLATGTRSLWAPLLLGFGFALLAMNVIDKPL